jgi:hypothetical protein
MNTIADVMRAQAPTTPDDWICPHCQNYKGKLKCAKNVFICFVGANMSGCSWYIEERRRNRE